LKTAERFSSFTAIEPALKPRETRNARVRIESRLCLPMEFTKSIKIFAAQDTIDDGPKVHSIAALIKEPT
jgi:hypothetical protein